LDAGIRIGSNSCRIQPRGIGAMLRSKGLFRRKRANRDQLTKTRHCFSKCLRHNVAFQLVSWYYRDLLTAACLLRSWDFQCSDGSMAHLAPKRVPTPADKG
jgi:hypothetical protein